MSVDAYRVEQSLMETYRVPEAFARQIGSVFAQVATLKSRVETLEQQNADLRALLPPDTPTQSVAPVHRKRSKWD